MKRYKIEFKFRWWDFWIGFYYDRGGRTLFICPLPMCRFKIYKIFLEGRKHDKLLSVVKSK